MKRHDAFEKLITAQQLKMNALHTYGNLKDRTFIVHILILYFIYSLK